MDLESSEAGGYADKGAEYFGASFLDQLDSGQPRYFKILLPSFVTSFNSALACNRIYDFGKDKYEVEITSVTAKWI